MFLILLSTPPWHAKWTHEAMSGPDSKLFREAMVTEVTALTKKNTWTLVPCSLAINHKALPGTWDFKRKLFPDAGRVCKCKARFCVHLQKEGIDYFETYGPVVQWSCTVHALLFMSMVLGLETQQIDFRMHFVRPTLQKNSMLRRPKTVVTFKFVTWS